jgi:mttA/Hcf106 family
VFEGLLSPWHLAIIAFVAFVVVGPKKLAERWKALSHTVVQWGDEEAMDGPPAATTAEEPSPPAEPAPSLARRIGRRFTRRRRRSLR